MKALYVVIGAFVIFMWSADIPYFAQFGSHISESVMVWRLTPGYAIGLIFSSFSYWGFSLVFLFFFIVYLRFMNRLMTRYWLHVKEGSAHFLFSFPLLIVVAFFLFWGARGRLSKKSPIHEGMAIVSHNPFVNQIGLNPTFTFVKSMNRGDNNGGYEHIQEDLAFSRRFFPNNFFPENGVLTTTSTAAANDSIRPMNVVIVLMESLSMAKLGYYHNKNLSPYLTQLAGESVFFDRFFSSGIHTFNGLFSSVSGFPSIYTEQGLRRYTRRPFPTLAMQLKPYGYDTYFCATHDPVFDNMEGFFRLNGFDKVISSNDFDRSKSLGVTGVPDHLLYEKLVTTLNKRQKKDPFVAWVMTGTDHGPWVIPKDIPFHPQEATDKENASRYADWAVQQFIENAKKQDWYENTIFVFTGDHGQITYDVYDMPITYHHVPLIIHCPKLLKPELRHTLGYQPDLTKTVASLLNIKTEFPGFGANLFKEERSFIFFSADDKIGYVTDDDFFFYHLLTSDQKKLVRYRNMSRTNYYESQKARADSLYKLTQSLYTASRYIIHKNYFNF